MPRSNMSWPTASMKDSKSASALWHDSNCPSFIKNIDTRHGVPLSQRLVSLDLLVLSQAGFFDERQGQFAVWLMSEERQP